MNEPANYSAMGKSIKLATECCSCVRLPIQDGKSLEEQLAEGASLYMYLPLNIK